MEAPYSEPLPRLNEKSSKSKKSKSKVPQTDPIPKKPKTFNRLDHRFQLTDEHDDEHIFLEEYEMIKQLRAKFPGLKNYSDKELVCFLCARRHKMDKVEILIEKHLKLRQELDIDNKEITSKDGWKFMEQGNVYYWPGCVDKHGRIVQYFKIGKENPKHTNMEEKMRFNFWEADYLVRFWSLRHLRNGHVMVVDMKDFSWNNLDLTNGKEVTDAMTGLFWRRIRGFVVINGGFIVRAAVKAAKMMMSKKLMKRIEIVDNLTYLIEPQHVLAEYGGKLQVTTDDIHKHVVLKTDE